MKSADSCTSIEEIRNAIDTIDREVIRLLGERFQYIKEIIRFKKPTEESIVAKNRFEAVIASRREQALKNGLDPDLIERVYRELLNHFISEEMKLIKQK
ncbi:Isochorismate pyruvate lyase [subsurface metagenome]